MDARGCHNLESTMAMPVLASTQNPVRAGRIRFTGSRISPSCSAHLETRRSQRTGLVPARKNTLEAHDTFGAWSAAIAFDASRVPSIAARLTNSAQVR